ncbi:MAG: hypothetical protein C0417_01350 [Chlorobiaceae bacterium]|nr:hypothetical protein [Chlorobiaceae bacterium]
MSENDIRRIRFDDDLERYQGFFDHQWVKDFEKIIRGSKLDGMVFDLSLEWKAISCVRRWPWLMIHGIKDSIEGALNAQPLPKVHMNLQDIWSQYQQEHEFNMALWMSEISAYCAVYFAYEVFLINSVKAATGLKSLRTQQLPDEIKKLLGSSICTQCWKDEPIELARLIRHAVAHNGRKLTQDLTKYKHKLVLEGNEIVIMARDTTDLYNLLKQRVLSFANEAVKYPSFTCPRR